MRIFLAFLLAITFSLNAAYAASLGFCDLLGHSSNHAWHFGHHSHDDEHSDFQVGSDSTSKTTSVDADHHHSHVHSSFLSILPRIAGLAQVDRYAPAIEIASKVFISATLTSLDRPPKTILA